MNAETYSIGEAAERSGLTTFVIRAWERRYGLLEPERTSSNRRRYSERDVEHLRLLRLLTGAGEHIGDIAALDPAALRRLADTRLADNPEHLREQLKEKSAPHVEELLLLTRALDARGLERALLELSVTFSRRDFLEGIAGGFMSRIGEEWQHGDLRIVNEHLATAVLHSFLLTMLTTADETEQGPLLLAATPAGQMHELGGIIAANRAALEGWRAVWLGADIPAVDIAAAARSLGADALLLSIVYPPDDALLHAELAQIGRLLPDGTTVFAGGRAAHAYEATLRRMHARYIDALDELGTALGKLR